MGFYNRRDIMEKLKLKVGMYVLQEWVNEDYTSKRLRYISRESGKYFYADAIRHCFDYDNGLYKFEASWATKFKKADNEQGFERSISERTNTDGIMTYTVYEDLSKIPRLKSYKEIFGHDLRKIQDPLDRPLFDLLNYEKLGVEPGCNIDWKIQIFEQDINKAWNSAMLLKLKELFKVDKIYHVFPEIKEYRKRTILSNSSINFHFNLFGIDKKVLTQDENYLNRDITLWLFEDFLVYQLGDSE